MPQQMIWFFVSIAFSFIAWGLVVLGNSAKSFPVTIRSRDLPFSDLARDSTAICRGRSARWTYAEPLMTYVGGTALPSYGTPVPDRGII